MLRFNPGKERSVWPKYNPYTIRRCRDCDIANDSKLTNEKNNPSELKQCAACKELKRRAPKHKNPKAGIADDSNSPEIKDRLIPPYKSRKLKKAALEYHRNTSQVIEMPNGTSAYLKTIKLDNGDEIIISKELIDETYSKCQHKPTCVRQLKALAKLDEWITHLRYVRTEPGTDHEFNFRIYYVEIDGSPYEFQAKITIGYRAYLLKPLNTKKDP